MQADYFRHRVLDFGWLMRSAIQSEGPMFQGQEWGGPLANLLVTNRIVSFD